jgi:chromosome segregation ATPase
MKLDLKKLSVLLILILGISVSPAFSVVKPGTTCKKSGLTQTYAGKKYTCVKLGNKLVWNKGVISISTAAAKKAADALKAKKAAEAKAAAELKAKQEAEAKAAAELKAKQEAEAKAAAELKAKQEAEALLTATRTRELLFISDFTKIYIPIKDRQTPKGEKEKEVLNVSRLSLEKIQSDLSSELVSVLDRKSFLTSSISELNKSITAQNLTTNELKMKLSDTNASVAILAAATDSGYKKYAETAAVTTSYEIAASRAESENITMLGAKVLCDFGFGSCDIYNSTVYNLNAATIRSRNAAKVNSDNAYDAYSQAYEKYKSAYDGIATIQNQIVQSTSTIQKLTSELSTNTTNLQALSISESSTRAKLDANLLLRKFNNDQNNKLILLAKDIESRLSSLAETEILFSGKWSELNKNIEASQLIGVSVELWSQSIGQLNSLVDLMNSYGLDLDKLTKAIAVIPSQTG